MRATRLSVECASLALRILPAAEEQLAEAAAASSPPRFRRTGFSIQKRLTNSSKLDAQMASSRGVIASSKVAASVSVHSGIAGESRPEIGGREMTNYW